MPQLWDGEVDAFRFFLVASGKSQSTIKNYVAAAAMFTGKALGEAFANAMQWLWDKGALLLDRLREVRDHRRKTRVDGTDKD